MHLPTVRVIEVLNYITFADSPLRLTDISRELGIPKGTLLPILRTLCRYDYISRNKSDEYEPGMALFSLGAHVKGKIPFMEFVRKKLCEIVSEYGETCYFGKLDSGKVVYLEMAESTKPIRMLASVGKRLPAYATGIGKALLIDFSKDELKEMYPHGLAALTKNTVTCFDVLSSQLYDARNNGYSTECEESTEHIRCFGVPVKKNGQTIFAISIAIPVFRYEPTLEKDIIRKLKIAASQIENALLISDTDIK